MEFWGISWSTAAAVLGVASATLIALHLLRIRSRTVRVVTCMFWEDVLSQSRARTLPGKFRHPLTFLFLLLICCLIVLGLTHPVLVSKADRLSHRVLVLDAGCSMAARDANGLSRLDEAIDNICKRVRESGNDIRWAVVVADPEPRLVHDFRSPRSLLPVNLEQIEPAPAVADREDAVFLAFSLLSGKSDTGVMLFTDHEMVSGKSEIPLRVGYVGKPVDNLACISAVFEAYPENPMQGQLNFRIGNWGRGTAQAAVNVEDDSGAELWRQDVTFEPGQVSRFSVANVRADGRRLRISVECDDALEQDNERVFDLPDGVPVRVWADSGAAGPLMVALKNTPSVELIPDRAQCDVAIVVNPSETPDKPAIIIHTGEQAVSAGGKIHFGRYVDWPDMWLQENLICGTGPYLDSLPADALDLFLIDNKAVAAFADNGRNRQLHLSSALLSEEATFWKKPLFAIVLARAIDFLAEGEQAGEDGVHGLFVNRKSRNVFSEDHRRFDLSEVTAASTSPTDVVAAGSGTMMDLLQWIILLVLIATTIECWLFVKGRIV